MTTSTTIIGDNMSPKKKLSKLFKLSLIYNCLIKNMNTN